MNFLRASVTRENGHARVTLGEQSLVGPAARPTLAATARPATGDVLLGIRAENIEASAGGPGAAAAPLDGEMLWSSRSARTC